jgi:exonuclease, DNA polymerase III, epsilon subunit family
MEPTTSTSASSTSSATNRKIQDLPDFQSKQAESKAKREQENALLRSYGYRWKKEQISDQSGGFIERWVLRTPEGRAISQQEAMQEVMRIQEQQRSHPAVLWANDMLARPNVVVLDTETTGLGTVDEIIDLAIIDTTGRTRLNLLMQCQHETIPAEAIAIHHITKEMLQNAHSFPRIWERLMSFLATREIIIYNAEFDMRMLHQTAQRYHLPLPKLHAHCIMQRYAELIGQRRPGSNEYRSFKLSVACQHIGIEQPNAHRALADTQSTLALLQKMAALADVQGE